MSNNRLRCHSVVPHCTREVTDPLKCPELENWFEKTHVLGFSL